MTDRPTQVGGLALSQSIEGTRYLALHLVSEFMSESEFSPSQVACCREAMCDLVAAAARCSDELTACEHDLAISLVSKVAGFMAALWRLIDALDVSLEGMASRWPSNGLVPVDQYTDEKLAFLASNTKHLTKMKSESAAISQTKIEVLSEK